MIASDPITIGRLATTTTGGGQTVSFFEPIFDVFSGLAYLADPVPIPSGDGDGGSGGGTPGVAVPEPGGVALLGLALTLWAGRARRAAATSPGCARSAG